MEPSTVAGLSRALVLGLPSVLRGLISRFWTGNGTSHGKD